MNAKLGATVLIYDYFGHAAIFTVDQSETHDESFLISKYMQLVKNVSSRDPLQDALR